MVNFIGIRETYKIYKLKFSVGAIAFIIMSGWKF